MRSPVLLVTISATMLCTGLVLTGCDHSGHDGINTPVRAKSAEQLPRLLSVVPAAIDDDTRIAFSAESVLAKDDQLSELQHGVRGTGADSLASDVHTLKEDLGIDLLGADEIVTVGSAPDSVTFVHGGQDADAITKAAEELGYTGEKILKHEPDLTDGPVPLKAAHLRVDGDSVTLGGQGADLTTDPGKVPASVKAMSKCLGSSPVATFDSAGSTPAAVGLKQGSPASGVVCTYDPDKATATSLGKDIEEAIDNDLSIDRLPYSDLLSVDKVSHPTATTSRVDVSFQDDRAPNVLWQMQSRRDLPGIH